ncbi:DUF1643 domain-containing protein [Rhodanobacter glycinis]|uniref:DUF1643 domain-containing protein n=1 Tax=Rhodanobacter glycinis TaxID=582702 RepID=UPI001127F15B|nr:DUF1643 domain-containing protein [Rhodanobacter glycinis]TPG50706.1 DUF1643 domain-containing protein [Rhodanobacter glycinis]
MTERSEQPNTNSAVISNCGQYRYRLERSISHAGPVIAFFGVNPSRADADIDDATVRKWRGFSQRLGASRFIVGNAFAYRSTDVKRLADMPSHEAIGPDNYNHLACIIAEADVLVPCWGTRNKLPKRLHGRLDWMRDLMNCSGRPVRVFGLARSGDPLHPLMLAYDTPLIEWVKP